jgi:hypothetical protein
MNGVSRFVFLMISAAALQLTGFAEEVRDATTVLNQVAKNLGADNLKVLHYSGSGSSYIVASAAVPAGGWPHSVMKSYVRDIDLDAITSRLQVVRSEGTPPADKTLTREINANSPWSSQYEFWITPYGFLKGAMTNNATAASKTLTGTTYTVVSFTLPGGHTVSGYINDKNMIERVETKAGDKNDVPVEALYRDYADFNGVKFPTLITEKQADELSLILIVKEAK